MKNQHRAGAFVAAPLVASGVSGHTVINEGEAVAGELTFITLRATHGCGTSPTTSFRVQIPDGVTRVAESGIHSAAHIRQLQQCGYQAFLVGEHLVTSGHPDKALIALKGAA